MTYYSHSREETEKIAADFAKTLKPNDVVAYFGSMGMGKTAFTRGIMLGLGADDVVSSPTFALVNEYSSPKFTVYHFDMYRISGWDDLYSTGFFDYLDSGAVLLIEWSENIENVLPEGTIYVEISKPEGGEDDDRIIKIGD